MIEAVIGGAAAIGIALVTGVVISYMDRNAQVDELEIRVGDLEHGRVDAGQRTP